MAQGHGRVGAAQGDRGDDGERQGGDAGEQQRHLAEGQFDEDRRDGPGGLAGEDDERDDRPGEDGAESDADE